MTLFCVHSVLSIQYMADPVTSLSFGELLVSALRCVGEAVTLALCGVYVTRKGILSQNDRKILSRISQDLTIPCLLFTSVLNCTQNWSTDPCPDIRSTLSDGWPLLILPVVNIAVGAFLGWLAVSLVPGQDKSMRGPAMAAVAFGNSTGMPITLLTVIHNSFPDTTELGAVDPVLFLSVYLLTYPVIQWSVGSYLLKPSRTATTVSITSSSSRRSVTSSRGGGGGRDDDDEKHTPLIESQPFPNDFNGTSTTRKSSTEDVSSPGVFGDRSTVGERELGLSGSLRKDGHLITAPQSMSEPLQTSPPSDHSHSSSVPASATMAPQKVPARLLSVPPWALVLWARVAPVLSAAFKPPVIASCLAIIISFTPMKPWFVDTHDRDNDAPLEWLFNGLYTIGRAAVPLNMIVLGSSLAKGVGIGQGKARVTNCLLAVSKLAVMPAIGVAEVMLLRQILDVDPLLDASFYLVVMLVTATPTANTILVMVQASGGNADAMTSCIFLQYLLCPVLLSLNITWFVSLAETF